MFEPLRQWGRTDPDDLSGKTLDALRETVEILSTPPASLEVKKRTRPPTVHRETARANAANAIDPHAAAIEKVVNDWLDRVERVTKTKIVGKKAREGTRHYKPPGTRHLLEMKAGEAEAASVLGAADAEGEHILPPAIFNLIRWRAELAGDAHPVIASILSDMAKQAYEGMQSELAQTIIGPGPPPQAQARVETQLGPGSPTFNASLKPMRDAIQAHTKSLVGFTDTVAQNIRDEIAAGEEEGLSIQQIANNVSDMVQAKRGYWTERIARTETTSAANEAGLMAAAQIPAVNKKQWLSAHDNRVREPPLAEFDHVAADGETVPIDEPFTATGEDLMYPGDQDGSAGNVINCRCTMIYTIGDDDAEIDPYVDPEGAKYSPDQPRDDHGRFAGGLGGSGGDAIALQTAAKEWSETPRPMRLGAADALHVDVPGYHEPQWPNNPEFNAQRQDNAEKARVLLRAVRDAPPSTRVLYRGLNIGVYDNAKEMGRFLASARVGATIDMPLAGFSASANTARGFSGGDVIVALQPGATAFNETPYSGHGEDEYISGGRFQVVDVRDNHQTEANHYLGDPYEGDGSDLASPRRWASNPGNEVPGPITITIKQLDTFDPDAGSKSLKGSDYVPYEFDYLFLGPAGGGGAKVEEKYRADQPRIPAGEPGGGRFGSTDGATSSGDTSSGDTSSGDTSSGDTSSGDTSSTGVDALVNDLNAGGMKIPDLMQNENADLIHGGGPNSSLEERGEAKAAIAHDLAGRMKSSTDDMLAATSLLNAGGISDQAAHDIASGDAVAAKVDWRDPNVIVVRTRNGELNSMINPVNHDAERTIAELRLRGDGDLYAQGGTDEAERVVREGAASALVQQWSISANDTDPESLALQHAAAVEFGIRGAADWPMDDSTAHDTHDDYDAHGEVYRDFLRSQYDATQADLASKGISELTVARGWVFDSSLPEEQAPPWARGVADQQDRSGSANYLPAQVALRPLSSWTMLDSIAHQFANSDFGGLGMVTYATVPASQVLSTARTGFGALIENETVLLGGTVPVAATTTFKFDGKADTAPSSIDNEDWLRMRSWDLPTDIDALRSMFSDDEIAKLLTLPCALAMPSALRAQIEGKKYSPDQPRDDHGRFSSGGGDASLAVDRMTMTQVREAASAIAAQRPGVPASTDLGSHDHPAPITVRGVTWHGRPERKPNLEDAARNMSIDLSKASPEQLSVLRSIARDNAGVQDYGRTYSATIDGQKYNVSFERADDTFTITGGSIASDHPEAMTEVLDRVTALASTDPPPNLSDLGSTRMTDRDSVDIFVGEVGQTGAAGITMGATVPGGGMMMIHDAMITQPENLPTTQDNVESGWSPPNAAHTDVLDYVITHEWGHLTDNRTEDQSNADWLNLHAQRGAISQYGATAPPEFYAEGWADYQLGPATAKPASLAMAKEYGWTLPT